MLANRTNPAAVLIAIAVALGGCATVAHGPDQKIRVVSNPPGALACVAAQCVDTPGVLVLPRKTREARVAFEKEGYVTRVVPLERKDSVPLWLNMAAIPAGIVVGGSIGSREGKGFTALGNAMKGAVVGGVALAGLCMTTDYVTGAAYKQSPGELTVDLVPVEPQPVQASGP